MICRAELFRSMVAREVAFFDSAEVGVLTSRLGSDCQAVVRCLSTNINVAARNAMQCLGLPCSLSPAPFRKSSPADSCCTLQPPMLLG